MNKLEQYEHQLSQTMTIAVMKAGFERGDTWVTIVNKLAKYCHSLEERIATLESKHK